jgi:hypothetical protein
LKRVVLILSIILSGIVLHAQATAKTAAVVSGVSVPVLRFYPNPATTAITFDFQKGFERGYSVQIYNFLGRKMYESTNVTETTTINLTDYTRGVYIYKLFDRTGRQVETGKFQVSK